MGLSLTKKLGVPENPTKNKWLRSSDQPTHVIALVRAYLNP